MSFALTCRRYLSHKSWCRVPRRCSTSAALCQELRPALALPITILAAASRGLTEEASPWLYGFSSRHQQTRATAETWPQWTQVGKKSPKRPTGCAPSQLHAAVTKPVPAPVWFWGPGGSAGSTEPPQHGEGEVAPLVLATVGTHLSNGWGPSPQEVQPLYFSSQTQWLFSTAP